MGEDEEAKDQDTRREGEKQFAPGPNNREPDEAVHVWWWCVGAFFGGRSCPSLAWLGLLIDFWLGWRGGQGGAPQFNQHRPAKTGGPASGGGGGDGDGDRGPHQDEVPLTAPSSLALTSPCGTFFFSFLFFPHTSPQPHHTSLPGLVRIPPDPAIRGMFLPHLTSSLFHLIHLSARTSCIHLA